MRVEANIDLRDALPGYAALATRYNIIHLI